jgi:hypothetical protein
LAPAARHRSGPRPNPQYHKAAPVDLSVPRIHPRNGKRAHVSPIPSASASASAHRAPRTGTAARNARTFPLPDDRTPTRNIPTRNLQPATRNPQHPAGRGPRRCEVGDSDALSQQRHSRPLAFLRHSQSGADVIGLSRRWPGAPVPSPRSPAPGDHHVSCALCAVHSVPCTLCRTLCAGHLHLHLHAAPCTCTWQKWPNASDPGANAW